MKVVIYPDVDIWQFVLSCLADREDVKLYPLNQYCNLFQKIVRKQSYLGRNMSWMVLGEDIRKRLSQLNPGDSVVLCEYSDVPLISALAYIIPNGVSRHLWLWNHQSQSSIFCKNIEKIRRLGFQVATYDEHNAVDLGLLWRPQFFPITKVHQDYSASTEITSDFFFAGYQKTRDREITSLHQTLSAYRCNFITVHNFNEYLSYPHYLQLALQSRCLVEIVRSGDPACTLRPLEALALHRKLLTNNPHIRQYSFYHPDNIFIFGEDDLILLSQFIKSPFHCVPEDILNTYDINTWIDSFN